MPERVTMLSRSEKSAKVVVAGESQRRTEREGVILWKAMCWKWHQMSALAERSGEGKVKPSLSRTVMKTDARALTKGARGKPQLLEPPGADPHAGWCGRGERETAPPIPIECRVLRVLAG
jgi:hypothetical protein